MVNNDGFHDGNRFFKHKYASIDLESVNVNEKVSQALMNF